MPERAEPTPTAADVPRESTDPPDNGAPGPQGSTGNGGPAAEKNAGKDRALDGRWAGLQRLLRSCRAHRVRTLLAVSILAVGTGLTLLPALTYYASELLPSVRIPEEWVNEDPAWWSLRSCAVVYTAVALHLWIRGDTHTPPSSHSLYPRSIWLHLITLLLPVVVWGAMHQRKEMDGSARNAIPEEIVPETIVLISGTALMALALILLPSRPYPWPIQDGTPDGYDPDATAARKRWAWAKHLGYATLTCALIVATAATGLVAMRSTKPVTGFTTSLSHPSSSGPDIIAHPQQDGTWSTSFNNAMGSLPSAIIPTSYGPILLRYSSEESEAIASLMVTSLNPEDGTARWQQDLRKNTKGNIENRYDTGWDIVTTDPDGQLIALHLKTSDGSQSNPSSHVIVLDTDTGAVTRQVTVEGKVINTALTADTLAVQTVDTSTPRANGRLLTYAATGPQAQQAGNDPQFTTATQSWLAGASRDSLLMTDIAIRGEYPTPCTVVLTDPLTGTELSSMDQVYKVHPHGWVERFLTDNPVAPDPSDRDSWWSLDRELVNVDSGASLNLQDMESRMYTDTTGYFLTLGRNQAENKDDVDWVEYGTVDIDIPKGGEPVFNESLPALKVDIPRSDDAVVLGTQENEG